MTDDSVVLVTGAGGFLGQYVTRDFCERGAIVIGLGNAPMEYALESGLTSYYQTTLPSRALREIVSKHRPEFCIHCAGASSVAQSIEDPALDFHAGPVVTFELLEVLRRYSPECRLAFFSSAAIYGNPDVLPIAETQPAAPISPYGYHKYLCEQLCIEYAKVYGMRTASARIFSAYGPGLRRQVVWDICQKAQRSKQLVLQGTGNESRDFIHAQDVARGVGLIAREAAMSGESYNLASGSETSIAELARLVISALGIDCSFRFDGTRPSSIPQNWRADINRIRALGFHPSIALDAGITSFVEWLRSESQ